MARLTFFVSLTLALSSIPYGLAGPACAKKHFQNPDCVSLCKSRWGWTGSMMGADPWGSVMKKVDGETWDAIIASACGLPVASATASTADATLAKTVIPATESANPTVVVTTASATSSAVSSITSIPVSSKASSVSASPSSVSALGLLASARSSARVFSTVRPTSSRITTVQQTAAATTQAAAAAAATTTAVSSSSSSGSTSSADIAAYLAGHNDVRAQHGASPLTWNDNLASKAQEWANGCAFKHSGGSLGAFGENLAAGTGSSYDIATAIKSWTDEVSEYDASNPQPSHFTQVVWKATTQVGCAVQSCEGIFDASYGPAKYFVCEYSPQGNVIGQFAQNVQA